MSSSQKKTSKSNKKKVTNVPITPPPMTPMNVYRPQMQDHSLYSTPNNHYPTMASNFVGFPPNQFVAITPNFGLYPQHQTPLQPHSQTPPNFGSFSQPQMPLETQPDFQTQPESHSEVEFVAETQFLSQPRCLHDSDTEDSVEELQQQQEEDTESRGKGKSTQRTERKGWTDMEVKVLAEAWLDISEDAANANNQSAKVFKERVWKSWCNRMGKEYRNPEQIYSKWRTTNKSCMEFNGVYMNVHRSWQSGANDLDVVAKARAVYKQRFLKAFTNEAFWNVVRDKEKWLRLETFDEFVTSSKRIKTSASTHSQSSDAHTGINLNNLDPYDNPRPPGRDQTKRKLKGVVGGSRITDEKIESFNTQIDRILSAQEVKVKNKLMEFALRDISGLTGFEYQIAMQAKKDAARQLGYTFDE